MAARWLEQQLRKAKVLSLFPFEASYKKKTKLHAYEKWKQKVAYEQKKSFVDTPNFTKLQDKFLNRPFSRERDGMSKDHTSKTKRTGLYVGKTKRREDLTSTPKHK